MKAIYINAKEKTVTEIEYEDYKEIQDLVGCPFTSAHIENNEDTLYVDDEGLFRSNLVSFKFSGVDQPLFGNGLLCGSNDEGESEDVKSSLESIRKKVTFIPIEKGAI